MNFLGCFQRTASFPKRSAICKQNTLSSISLYHPVLLCCFFSVSSASPERIGVASFFCYYPQPARPYPHSLRALEAVVCQLVQSPYRSLSALKSSAAQDSIDQGLALLCSYSSMDQFPGLELLLEVRQEGIPACSMAQKESEDQGPDARARSSGVHGARQARFQSGVNQHLRAVACMICFACYLMVRVGEGSGVARPQPSPI